MTQFKRDDVVKVLDHGYVKLIDYMGSDEAIIEAARMSTNKGFQGWDKDAKLLEYLYANRHMTPFEMGGEMTIEVQAPIMVFREWHRHRTQSFNELSGRYAKMPNLHYLPAADRYQRQSAHNKQGSAESLDQLTAAGIQAILSDEQDMVYGHYEDNLELGLAREVARINTPLSRYSRMRAKTDLRNWLHFLSLRMAPNAQWEIREYARVVADIIKSIWPRTFELFENYTLHSVSFSRDESDVLRYLIDPAYQEDALKADDAEAAVIRKILSKLRMGGY